MCLNSFAYEGNPALTAQTFPLVPAGKLLSVARDMASVTAGSRDEARRGTAGISMRSDLCLMHEDKEGRQRNVTHRA